MPNVPTPPPPSMFELLDAIGAAYGGPDTQWDWQAEQLAEMNVDHALVAATVEALPAHVRTRLLQALEMVSVATALVRRCCKELAWVEGEVRCPFDDDQERERALFRLLAGTGHIFDMVAGIGAAVEDATGCIGGRVSTPYDDVRVLAAMRSGPLGRGL